MAELEQPTNGELMRAIQKIEVAQGQIVDRMDAQFREFAGSLVGKDIYERDAKRIDEVMRETATRHGERMGRLEAENQEIKRALEQEKKDRRLDADERDKRERNFRMWLWATTGAPLVLGFVWLALGLVVNT